MSYRVWSEAERSTLRRMIDAGHTFTEIARELGRTVSSVEKCSRRLKYPSRINGGRVPSYPADFADRCAELHFMALCRHYGKTAKTMQRWIARSGCTPAVYVAPVRQKQSSFRSFGHARPTSIPGRDSTLHGQAAEALRRFAAVYRCNARGRADPSGDFYRYGNVVLTPDELVARAAARGWRMAA